MRVVIQRVKKGRILIGEKIFSEIKKGYVVLVGFGEFDKPNDVLKIAEKIAKLRIMADNEKKMNLDIIQAGGEILLVSQFTLYADTSKRRPSFIKVKKPEEAKKLYQLFINELSKKNISVKTGKFGENMTVEIINDGPVTIILDSQNLKNKL